MSASDAPQRPAGVRARSGNAMARTRTALLDAAAACIEQVGVRRTTMAGIAAAGGVAKATLYNHFRTKDDVLRALVEDRVAALGATCAAVAAEQGLQAALEQAADALTGCAPLRRVAEHEPALLLPLAVPGEGRGWQQAREAVAGMLGARSDPAAVELVLRWLLSRLLWPAPPDDAAVLVRGLGASAPPMSGREREHAHGGGLGWPDRVPDRLRTR